MSILQPGRPTANIPHEPDVCGLDTPDGPIYCNGCRAGQAERERELERQEKVARRQADRRQSRAKARKLARLFNLHPGILDRPLTPYARAIAKMEARVIQ